ncbi:MAG: aminotransferase [Coriobacteriales bacterium]|jgi:DNA-binding transcriptional MocR family regulator|nr:aminotransferase [Coriobacteriales bacterium]
MTYAEKSRHQLQDELDILTGEYARWQARGLALNMARGKPAPAALDLSRDLLDALPGDGAMTDAAGNDLRNYGLLTGLDEAKELMGQIMGVPAANVIVLGNSSLNIMYDTVSRSVTHGVLGFTPWAKLDKVKFLCPAPGYDRHFAITQHFGIQNIVVPMTPQGPDMTVVEHYVNTDPAVKGIWCVPKYSNPQGITYSAKTVRRFASLRPAAGDFRIYWDNAYAVHDLAEKGDQLADLKHAADAAGNPDLYYMFASTSKITFAGSGIAAVASSAANLAELQNTLFYQTIGADKINQMRHVHYLKDIEGVAAQMRRLAAVIAPKFDAVLKTLDAGLGGLGISSWTKPNGGYFISFDGLPGTAKRIVTLAKEAGVTLTSAGATYPYGKDPQDANIRIAPTYPSVDELALASELFVVCVKIASIELLLADKS